MLVSEVVSTLAGYLRDSNPNFSDIKFTKKVNGSIVDFNSFYAGIVDNKQDYAYLRISNPISFSNSADRAIKSTDCGSYVNNFNTILHLRLVTCVWNIRDPYLVLQRLLETLHSFQLSGIYKCTITPILFSPIKEDVIIQEVRDPQVRDNLEINALDFTLSYLWTMDECCPTSLCNKPDCDI